MQDMPRPRPPYLSHEKTRHGEMVWYVRRHGRRIRIRAEFGTSDFESEYQAALSAAPPRSEKGAPTSGTLAWLIGRYRETTAWTGFSLATRRQRENIFRKLIETAGDQPIARITAATIMAGRDRRSKTPFQARHFLDTLRHMFRWAVKAQMVKADPTIGVEYPRFPKGDGFEPWTDGDIAAYEARWPIGTRQRVWLDVLAYTGLRRGDAVRLGKQHVRDGEATIKTEKSGHKVEVIIPLHMFPALTETLRAGPTADLSFVCGANGKPMTKESFGNVFSEACRAAGIRKSAHGLRKLAATRAADAGATLWQLNGMFGWTGTKMASHYTQAADRKRHAREGFQKLTNENRTSIVAPSRQVRQSERKH